MGFRRGPKARGEVETALRDQSAAEMGRVSAEDELRRSRHRSLRHKFSRRFVFYQAMRIGGWYGRIAPRSVDRQDEETAGSQRCTGARWALKYLVDDPDGGGARSASGSPPGAAPEGGNGRDGQTGVLQACSLLLRLHARAAYATAADQRGSGGWRPRAICRTIDLPMLELAVDPGRKQAVIPAKNPAWLP